MPKVWADWRSSVWNFSASIAGASLGGLRRHPMWGGCIRRLHVGAFEDDIVERSLQLSFALVMCETVECSSFCRFQISKIKRYLLFWPWLCGAFMFLQWVIRSSMPPWKWHIWLKSPQKRACMGWGGVRWGEDGGNKHSSNWLTHNCLAQFYYNIHSTINYLTWLYFFVDISCVFKMWRTNLVDSFEYFHYCNVNLLQCCSHHFYAAKSFLFLRVLYTACTKHWNTYTSLIVEYRPNSKAS